MCSSDLSVRADDLGAIPIKALMARNPTVDWAAVVDVLYGCANQAGEDNRNVARMAALLAGLPIEVQLRDYRDIKGRYDAIASIGMFEAVGRRNHRRFMEVCRRSLATEGLLLLHTIGARGSGILESVDPWLSTRIFPEGELPGPRQIVDGAEGLFTIEDWHNFGADYDRTLMAWHARFKIGRAHV